MPKILNRAKNIVVLILLLTVFPLVFVEGFLAYVYHFSDDEGLRLFKQTYDVFYKICMNSAYISLFLTYIASHFIRKSQKLRKEFRFFSPLRAGKVAIRAKRVYN